MLFEMSYLFAADCDNALGIPIADRSIFAIIRQQPLLVRALNQVSQLMQQNCYSSFSSIGREFTNCEHGSVVSKRIRVIERTAKIQLGPGKQSVVETVRSAGDGDGLPRHSHGDAPVEVGSL